MKVNLLLTTTILCLLGSVWAQTCTYDKTWTGSVTPTSDTLIVESLSPAYDNFNVVWDESLNGDVEVSISVCSNDVNEYNSATFVLDNISGAVHLQLVQSAATTAPTVPPPSTSGGSSSEPTSPPTDSPTQPPTQSPSPTQPPTQPPTQNTTVNHSGASSSATPTILSFLLIAVTSLFILPRSRLSIALLLVAVALVMSTQSATASTASTSTTLTLNIAAPTSINQFCVSGQCFFRNSSGIVTKYVSFFNTRYAALSSLYGGYCNTSMIQQVPKGWRIANQTTETLLVIYLHDWSTYNVVVKDGTAYEAGYYGVSDAFEAIFTRPNYFPEGTSDDLTGYSVVYCDSIILITQDFPVPESAHEIIGLPRISHFVTFNGYDYAMADNTPFSANVSGCETYGVFVDSSSEWQLSPDESASLVVRQDSTSLSFGTDCVVMANGNSYKQDLTLCDSTGLITTPYKTGNIYTVKSCNKRIMVRRPSTLLNSWQTQVPITHNFFFAGGEYATLDNADPLDSTAASCQTHFLSIPAGWRLSTAAELTAFITAEGYSAWASTYCLATSGVAVGHTNVACSGTLLTKTVNGINYYTTTTCGRILLTQDLTVLTDFTIGMKVLVISVGTDIVADAQLGLALTMLNATGVTYDWWNLLDVNSNAVYTGTLPLLDANANPKYYAIVLTSGQLSYVDPVTKATLNALTTTQQTQLTLYKYYYSVRLVALTSYPSTALGVSFVAGGVAAPTGTFVRLDPSYVAANPTYFDGLRTDIGIDISGVYYVSVGASSNATPLLRLTSSPSEVPTSASPVVAAVIKLADGTEELHFFIGNSVTFTHGPLFSSVWLNWVTKEMWIGNRRVYFIPQIDDLFLETDQFDNPAIANRITGSDLIKTKAFLDALQVPAGSTTIRCEFGFNGAGVNKLPNSNAFSDELYDTTKTMIADFFFESHTFTHLDFTCPEEDCADYGTTTYDAAYGELENNINFAVDSLFSATGGLDTPTFSKNCMITPSITGLFNGNALKAILDAGIQCVVGDNSVPGLVPPNLYHGIITTAAVNGYDGVFIVPRAPTEIYFDVSSLASEVIEYNSRYGIRGSIIANTQNSTLDQILLAEGVKTVKNFLLFRHDAYMFHQGNLKHFNYTYMNDTQEKEWSLFTLWVQSVLDQYNSVMTLPWINVKHQDLWGVYLDRMARDACGIEATLTVSGGSASSVTLSASGTCEASITGLTSCGSASASSCRIEQYGPDTTVWAELDNSAITLPAQAAWN